MSIDLKKVLDDGPMARFQWLAIGICIVLNMIDGFDVLVMAFTASSVSAEWALNGAQIGLLLSAGLFGMAAGSLFIAPWADRYGRRPLILLCLLLSPAWAAWTGAWPPSTPSSNSGWQTPTSKRPWSVARQACPSPVPLPRKAAVPKVIKKFGALT